MVIIKIWYSNREKFSKFNLNPTHRPWFNNNLKLDVLILDEESKLSSYESQIPWNVSNHPIETNLDSYEYCETNLVLVPFKNTELPVLTLKSEILASNHDKNGSISQDSELFVPQRPWKYSNHSIFDDYSQAWL